MVVSELGKPIEFFKLLFEGDDYDTGHHGDDGHGWDEDDIVSVNRG